MKKLAIMITLFCSLAGAQIYQPINGWCELGGKGVAAPAALGGTPIQQFVQESYKGCTITVFQHGTTTPVQLYSTSLGTTLSNPFQADTRTGFYQAFAAGGLYDIQESGNISPAVSLGTVNLLGFYTVSEFGAKGDGVTNDSTAIQTAINTIGAAGGGTLYFPCGTYSLGGTLVHIGYSNIVLDGMGCSTIHQTVNNVGGILIASSDGVNFTQVHDVHVTGLRFTGSADGSASNISVGVNVDMPSVYSSGSGGAYNIMVDHSYFTGWTMATMFTGVTGVWVEDNAYTGQFYIPALGAGGYDVLVQSCYQVWVVHNRMIAQGNATTGDRHAVYIANDQNKPSAYQNEDVHVLGNSIDWRTPTTNTGFEEAIALRSTKRMDVSGNMIQGGFGGIGFNTGDGRGASSDVNIHDNSINGILGSGTHQLCGINTFSTDASLTTNLLITNNAIDLDVNNSFGICADSGYNVVVTGNTITVTGAASMGIAFYNDNYVKVGANVLDGSGSASRGEYYYGTTNNVQRSPSVIRGFADYVGNATSNPISLTSPNGIVFLDPTLSPFQDDRLNWYPTGNGLVTDGVLQIGRYSSETGNPALFVWGNDGSGGTNAKSGTLSVDTSLNFSLGSWADTNIWAGVTNGMLPPNGTLVAAFHQSSGDPRMLVGKQTDDTGAVLQVHGIVSAMGGSTGKVTCWKAGANGENIIGYCSTAPDVGGACTCN